MYLSYFYIIAISTYFIIKSRDAPSTKFTEYLSAEY